MLIKNESVQNKFVYYLNISFEVNSLRKMNGSLTFMFVRTVF